MTLKLATRLELLSCLLRMPTAASTPHPRGPLTHTVYIPLPGARIVKRGRCGRSRETSET